MSGETEYEVERILKERRKRNGSVEYLVRWVGYGQEEDQWVPDYDLEHAQEILAEYRARVQEAPRQNRRKRN